MHNIEKLKLTVHSVPGKIFFILDDRPELRSLKPERRKIYIVKRRDEFIYVGEAHCDLKTRMTRSLTSVRRYLKHGKGFRGYKGYKWMIDCANTDVSEFDIYVYIFSQEFDADSERIKVEAIEGELVLQIRNKTGKWPLSQNEIHFSNYPDGLNLAKTIFEYANSNV